MGKRVGKPKPQQDTRRSRFIAWGDRVLEHWRVLLAVLGVMVIAAGAAFDSTIEYEDTISVTAHYERYTVSSGRHRAPQITLYFTDHDPLSFGYRSTSRDMRTQLSLIPPGEELIMRLHPVTREILSLAEDDRTHFTFEQSYRKSTTFQRPTGIGLCLILLAVVGNKRKS